VENGGYCYRDFPEKKLRVFLLNTSEQIISKQLDYGTLPAQQLWTANALKDLGSKADAAQWGFIVLCHYPLDYGEARPISNVFKAYVNGESITVGGSTVSFQGCNSAKFLAQFHGHTHCFKTARLNGYDSTGTMKEYDAWRVAIPNVQYNRENYYTDPMYGIYFNDDKTYTKTPGTAEETSFVVNVINPSDKVIHSFCFGAGYDRTIDIAATVYYSITKSLTKVTISDDAISVEDGDSYTAVVTAESGYTLDTVKVTMGGTDITSSAYSNGTITIAKVTGNVVITATAIKQVNYTNLVRTSTDSSGAIYNGTGYKDNTRISSSGNESVENGFCATGFIKLPGNSKSFTLRLGGEGISWNVYGCQMCVYDSSFIASSTSMNYSQFVSQNAGYGTWDTTEANSVFALTVAENHAFTKAAYMRISAKGSGGNLVVTINEKIE
jgi:hypothetical protein